MTWGETRFLIRMGILAVVVIGAILWYAGSVWLYEFQQDPLLVGGGTFAVVGTLVGVAVAWGRAEKKRQEAWAKAQEDDSDNRTV